VSSPDQTRLLDALPPAERERIFPHLRLVTLPLGTVLYESGDTQRYIYFPVDAIVSLLYLLTSSFAGGYCSLDRLDGSRLVMTQELIANMLGVRRDRLFPAAAT
jgi:hypothetical protein